MGRIIARRGAGLLVVYLSDEDRRETSAHGIATMGTVKATERAAALAAVEEGFTALLDGLRELDLFVWRLDEPTGTPKPAGQLEPWMVS